MSSVDVEQAASIPLPLSPPAGGSATLSFPLPDQEPIHTESTNEQQADPTKEAQHQVSVHDDANVKKAVETSAVEKSAKEVEDPASSQVQVAPGESELGSSPVASQESRTSTSTIPTIPPTPPAKSDALPEVRSPPPRHDSLTSASPAQSVRQSEDHPVGKRANGHAGPHGSPGRPASSASHRRSLTISKGRTVSAVLVSSALETIAASREAKRSQPLRESVQRALEMVKRGEGGDRPRDIFEPLRLACETRNEKLMIASLDCISKLISYSFFVEADQPSQGLPSPPPSPGPGGRPSTSSANHPPGGTLVDLVVHTITSCHSESAPETVSLQIVKALLALVLSSTVLVHQSSLLKAVRTVYNVFLLSVDPINQTVAQGGLTQMVNHVFARCKLEPHSRSRTASSATLASRTESLKQRSLAPNSPLRSSSPLSPPASVDNHSMHEIAEPAPSHLNENIARASPAVDTPGSETVELPANGHAEEMPETPNKPSQHWQSVFIVYLYLIWSHMCTGRRQNLRPVKWSTKNRRRSRWRCQRMISLLRTRS